MTEDMTEENSVNDPREELDEATFNTIDSLADEGEQLLDEGEFAKAAAKFDEAFKLVPEPFQDWEISIWLLTALGESYFLAENYEKSREIFNKALECPDAEDSPPIFLRLGQIEFELDNKEKAAELMLQAYEAEGPELFDEEDEKYLEYLTRVYEL